MTTTNTIPYNDTHLGSYIEESKSGDTQEIRDAEIHHDDIDFDDAHTQWIKNKRKLANGLYRYICVGMFQNGKLCNRTPISGKNACRIHMRNDNGDPDVICTPLKSKPVRKPRESVVVLDSEETVVKTKSGNIRQLVKQMADTLANSSNTSRTLPINDIHTNRVNGIVRFNDTEIDINKGTIRLLTVSVMSSSFDDLAKALRAYESINRVRTVEMTRKHRYKIYKVVYHLQLIVSFLEGLNEMTKLDTKRESIMHLKECILRFMEYDPTIHLHTTTGKWFDASRNIQDDIAYVMDELLG
jgi:hypothetical protein